MNWETLENAPDYLEPVVDLIRWAMNEDYRRGTCYRVFLDLTGYSLENYGETINEGRYTLGYVEADYLADALKVWANNPESVFDFIYQWETAPEND